MGKKIKIRKERLSSFFIYSAIAIWLLSGCATPSSTGEIRADEAKALSTEQPSFTQNDEIPEYQEMQLAAKIPESIQEETEEAEFTETEPRILIEPQRSDLNQVLGIDFTMLEHGKSRLMVTTDKKVTYDLDREGEKGLVLNLYDTTIIPSLLLREIDTTEFKSALDRIRPVLSAEDNKVTLNISLREMVPFHIKETTNGLNVEFGQTTIMPPEKKILPLDLAEAQTSYLAARQPTMMEAGTATLPGAAAAVEQQRQYSGEPMTLEFVNADVTHILRLINEISDENVIWDPVIKGRTVSMILEDVPWDQALDLILDNNDLAKRYRGDNIIWITTKAKMKQILLEEEEEAKKRQQAIEEELEREESQKKRAEQEAPLITEFLPVDFATADEIQGHITLTDRGTMSIDTRTNTIIIKDTAESIEEAKKTVTQFDTPVKQIMIEARIVDASDNFSRDLGLQWNSTTSAWRRNINTDVEVPPYANDFEYAGERVWGGSFSSNAPEGWASNIGLNYAVTTTSGLGLATLDASLALAETEGTAKIMSAPKVIAREGTAATISSGDSIIIPATENVASTTIEATLSLTVTPSAVSYNDYITLDVSVTDDQAPSTSRLLRKAISTTLMVKSGETVVIGGIIKETEASDESGIPGLRNIPGLGWMFKAKRKSNTKSELLIFLTPTVLPSPARTF